MIRCECVCLVYMLVRLWVVVVGEGTFYEEIRNNIFSIWASVDFGARRGLTLTEYYVSAAYKGELTELASVSVRRSVAVGTPTRAAAWNSCSTLSADLADTWNCWTKSIVLTALFKSGQTCISSSPFHLLSPPCWISTLFRAIIIGASSGACL